MCEPIGIAEGLLRPRLLRVGPRQGYYVSDELLSSDRSRIWARELDTSAEPVALYSSVDTIRDLEFDGEQLFWITDGQVLSMMPIPGQAPLTVAEDATPLAALSHLALSESHVYVTRVDGSLERVPKSGGPLEPVATDCGTMPVVGDDYVYWSPPGGPIRRLRMSDDSIEAFDWSSFAGAAQVYAGELYWVAAEGDETWLKRKGDYGEDVDQVAIGADCCFHLLVSDHGVLVSAEESGTVQLVDLDARDSNVIARGQIGVRDLAADAQFAYWLTDQRLMRLAR
jgi:hypothetical protein